ncbi:unnamed protein product [Dibothriocephalus latus]|uniref:Choline/carnitine acyltransferase domain-containing protein n=1 Tax=Dibothriocephalus latus TaxID=60516 RepID=A0A3P7NGR4_DIBLA|nr:unnamed protein product [Dibothriocephalus latus]
MDTDIACGKFTAFSKSSIKSAGLSPDAFIQTISSSEKCALLRKAIEQHQLYTKMTATGHGFDRHLLGLRLIAADSGDPTPSIFADPTYENANHFSLTTSQITGKQDFGASFDPLIPDGYGFTYNLQGHYMNLTASTFKSKTSDNAAVNLINAFAASLLDMRKLLEGSVEVDINEK